MPRSGRSDLQPCPRRTPAAELMEKHSLSDQNVLVPVSGPDKGMRSLLASLTVAAIFLASNFLELYGRIQGMASSDALNKKITHASLYGPVVLGDLIMFLVGIAVLHVMVGILGWLLSRMTTSTIVVLGRLPQVLISALATMLLFGWAYASLGKLAQPEAR